MNLERLRQWFNLTEAQAKLAVAYVETGVLATAARRAELSYDQAKSLLHEHMNFQGAVNALLGTMLIDDKVKARALMRAMMEDDDSSATLRFNAAKELWNRADGEPIKRTLERREITLGLDATALRIIQLAQELGLGLTGQTLEGIGTGNADRAIPEGPQGKQNLALPAGKETRTD